MEEPTDEQLMQLVIAGKNAGINQLVGRYQIKLFRYFMRMSGDRFKSEDLVQLTFERVYKYRNSFKADQAFKTWVFQIARNVWSTEFRKWEKNEERKSLTAPSMATNPTSDYDLQQLIQTALIELPEKERELVVFYHLKGFSYKELSHLFETSEGNLRVIQCRALKKMGKILKRLGYEH